MNTVKRFLLFCITILSFCAWSMPTGWQYPSLVPGYYSTTNQTLTSAQSGQILVFTGTAQDTKVFLPTATVGLDFIVISNVAKYFALQPQATDTIALTSVLQGQPISNNGSAAIGDNIELVCIVAGTWSIRDKIGTWAQGS